MKNRRILSLVLCISMVMALFTGVVSTASADDVITHTVVSGEYLVGICKHYGLDYYQCKNAIMILNGFTSEYRLNRLSVGETIKLPASNAVAATVKGTTTTTTTVTTSTIVNGTTTTTSTSSTVAGNTASSGVAAAYYLIPHVVQYGETLNGICNAYGTSYAQYASAILALNGIKNANSLAVNKTIYIPSSKAPSSGSYYAVVAHTVASGETVTSICSKYGISAAAYSTMLAGLNNTTNLNKIVAGQKLYIPCLTTAAAATTVATTVSSSTASTATTTANTGYQISVAAADEGNPYVIVGSTSYATRAEAGVSVVIVPNANSGYAVQGISVVRTDSNSNVSVTNNAFTMPASNVTIKITYAKGLKISKQISAYGTFDALVYGSSATSAFYGDEVLVRTTPISGYSVQKVYYTNATGTVSTGTAVEADKETGEYKFSMPNYDIKLVVEYELTTYHALTVNKIGQGTVVFKVDGKEVLKAEKGTIVTAVVTPASGWVLDDSFTITGMNGKYTKVNSTTYTFKMGSSDVTVSAKFNNMNAYNLTASSVTGGSVSFTVTGTDGTVRKGATWAHKGDTVQIVPSASNKYSYDPLTTADNTTLASTGSKLTTWTQSGYTFTMPDANVKVIPQFITSTNTYYTISKGDVKNGSGYFTCYDVSGNEITKSTASETITIKVFPNDNLKVEKVEYSDKSGYHEITVANTTESVNGVQRDVAIGTFTMPAVNTKIRITYALGYQAVAISANVIRSDDLAATECGIVPVYYDGYGNEYVHMFVNNQRVTDNAIVGSTVTFNFTLKTTPDAYEVDKVVVCGGNLSAEKTLTADSKGNYSYKVTESDYQSGNPIEFRVYTKQSDKVTYDVLYSSPEHGSYTINTVSANTKAIEGAQVTLVIKPDSGYSIDQVIINGIVKSAADLVWNGTNYELQFTMPAAKVTTQVTFKYTGTMKVKAVADTNGTVPGAATWTAVPGESVTVTFRPNAGYKVSKIDVAAGSVTTTYTIEDSTTSADYTFSFNMPSADTTVTAHFDKDYVNAGVQLTCVADAAKGTLTANGSATYTAQKGEAVTFTIQANSGYKLTKLEIGSVAIDMEGTVGGACTYIYTVKDTDADMNVHAYFTSATAVELTWATASVNDGSGTLNYSGKTSEEAGTEITLVCTAAADSKLTQITVGTTVKNITDSTLGGTYYYTFTVPTTATTVTATFDKSQTVTVTNDGYATTVVSDEYAAAGTDITITDTADSKHKLVSITVGGTTYNITDAQTGTLYTRTVKLSSVPTTVTTTHKLMVLPITATAENGTITAPPAEGEIKSVVSIVCKPDTGLKVKQVIINSTQIVNINDSIVDTPYTYNLTIPDGTAVTVSVVCG